MELILQSEVAKLGQALEVVNVKPGYARNFLLPRGLAVLATPAAKAMLEQDRARLEARLEKDRAAAAALLAKVEEASVTLQVKVVDGEKLYGSVGANDISENLKSQGLRVEKRAILLEEAIRQVGVYTVPVKLFAGVEGNVKVWVVKLED